jgi:F0F1-type ATP synthase delta subunit
MLGGAKVRLGDLLIDTTLRTRLANLSRAIAESV